jgi:hypothetical protein
MLVNELAVHDVSTLANPGFYYLLHAVPGGDYVLGA